MPIPQERHLASHPLVADAVMFGRAKLQAGVLVDPAPQHLVDPNDMVAVSKYIDEIWYAALSTICVMMLINVLLGLVSSKRTQELLRLLGYSGK